MPPRVFFQPYEFMLCAKLRRDNMPSCFCFIFFSVSGALSLFNPGRECVPICFVIYIRYTSRTQRPFLFHCCSPYIPLILTSRSDIWSRALIGAEAPTRQPSTPLTFSV